ncbi:MAG TPA: hypothetical protein VGV67_04900 [Solirubrobacteraceae bacterium]|nr:hypothetical protein [Solirubrobacteraceae bacterium]
MTAFTRSNVSAGSSAAGRWGLDAGVVEREVDPAEGVHRAVHEGGDLGLVGDVAGDAERLITGGGQLVGGGAQRLLVDVGEHDGRPRGSEGAGGLEAHAGARAGDERDAAVEVVRRVRRRQAHGLTMPLIDSRSAIVR